MHISSFIWKDLTRRTQELWLVILGVGFAVCAVFILFALRIGIEQTLFEAQEKKNPLAEITVYGGSGTFLKLLGASRQKTLDPQTLQTFEKLPHVKRALPHMIYQNLASTEVEILGQTLQTDTLIFGMPREVIENDLPANEPWENAESSAGANAIPVLVSRKLIDFYNLSLASGAGLPNLSEEMFKGKNIKIYPEYSSFFANQEKPKKILNGRVVGFSDRVDLVGITVPIETVRNFNASEGKITDTYNKVFLTLDSPRSVETVSKQLESDGYRVTSLQKEFQDVSRSLKYVEIIFFILSAVILAVALLLIGNTFWAQLLKRRQELGILRAIGATRFTLSSIFFLEAIGIGLIGALIGIAVGETAIFTFQKLLMKNFALASLSIEKIFLASPKLIISLFLITPLLTALASGIPIIGTLKKSPRALFVK
ncbi:ABC transporter permease [Candidatus Peregrinibacteria bacterium]|nr:ABC transporter permease [Candidatus Peregrinibacteria bacterium]